MRETVYGRNPVYEVLRAARRRVHRLWVAEGAQEKGTLAKTLVLAQRSGIPVQRVPRARLDHDSNSHQGIAAEVDPYPYVDVDDLLDLAERRGEPPLILILDIVQNPQNLGTLLRTAEAVGAHGLILPERRGAGVTPAVVNASAGASEHMRIAVANLARSIQRLKERDVWIVGLEASPEARVLGDVNLSGPLGLVIGNEGEGMRRLVRESCDFLLRLPMRGEIESLNAAVAGSIALYAAWQARKFAGATRPAIDADPESC